jgi:hypothetical protein
VPERGLFQCERENRVNFGGSLREAPVEIRLDGYANLETQILFSRAESLTENTAFPSVKLLPVTPGSVSQFASDTGSTMEKRGKRGPHRWKPTCRIYPTCNGDSHFCDNRLASCQPSLPTQREPEGSTR